MGSVMQDEADEDDRGQTVNLILILKVMGSHWRILSNRAGLFKKITLAICMEHGWRVGKAGCGSADKSSR